MSAACSLCSHYEARTEPASEIYHAQYIIVSSRSEPPRSIVRFLFVERRADGVPGVKYGGIAVFVIQLLECYCNAAACC